MSENSSPKKSTNSIEVISLDSLFIGILSLVVGGVVIYLMTEQFFSGSTSFSGNNQRGATPMEGYGTALEELSFFIVSQILIVLVVVIIINFLWALIELVTGFTMGKRIMKAENPETTIFEKFFFVFLKMLARVVLSIIVMSSILFLLTIVLGILFDI